MENDSKGQSPGPVQLPPLYWLLVAFAIPFTYALYLGGLNFIWLTSVVAAISLWQGWCIALAWLSPKELSRWGSLGQELSFWMATIGVAIVITLIIHDESTWAGIDVLWTGAVWLLASLMPAGAARLLK